MPDYRKMYFQLAAQVADAIEILLAAQQQGEDSYSQTEQGELAELKPHLQPPDVDDDE